MEDPRDDGRPRPFSSDKLRQLLDGGSLPDVVGGHDGVDMESFATQMERLLHFLRSDRDGAMSAMVHTMVFPHARATVRRVGQLGREDDPLRMNFWLDQFQIIAHYVLAITKHLEAHPEFAWDIEHLTSVYKEEAQAYFSSVRKRLGLPAGEIAWPEGGEAE